LGHSDDQPCCYKLIITNSIAAALGNFCYLYGVYWWAGGATNPKAKTQYDHTHVSQAYIDLNYNQALFLVGVLFAPMLPILWVIMNVFEFSVLFFCLRRFCRLAEKPFEATDRNYTLYYLTVTWVIGAFPMAFFLTRSPSTNCALIPESRCICGPFQRDIRMPYEALAHFVVDRMNWLVDVYDYLLNPLIIWGLLLLCAIFILWISTQLRQVRKECAGSYLANLELVRDKHALLKARDEEEQEHKQQMLSLATDYEPQGPANSSAPPRPAFTRGFSNLTEGSIAEEKPHSEWM